MPHCPVRCLPGRVQSASARRCPRRDADRCPRDRPARSPWPARRARRSRRGRGRWRPSAADARCWSPGRPRSARSRSSAARATRRADATTPPTSADRRRPRRRRTERRARRRRARGDRDLLLHDRRDRRRRCWPPWCCWPSLLLGRCAGCATRDWRRRRASPSPRRSTSTSLEAPAPLARDDGRRTPRRSARCSPRARRATRSSRAGTGSRSRPRAAGVRRQAVGDLRRSSPCACSTWSRPTTAAVTRLADALPRGAVLRPRDRPRRTGPRPLEALDVDPRGRCGAGRGAGDERPRRWWRLAGRDRGRVRRGLGVVLVAARLRARPAAAAAARRAGRGGARRWSLDALARPGPSWTVRRRRTPVDGRRARTPGSATYVRVLEGHLTARTPTRRCATGWPTLADRAAAPAPRPRPRRPGRGRACSGPTLAGVLTGPPRRLSRAEIERLRATDRGAVSDAVTARPSVAEASAAGRAGARRGRAGRRRQARAR